LRQFEQADLALVAGTAEGNLPWEMSLKSMLACAADEP
jgi:hypothetical protein